MHPKNKTASTCEEPFPRLKELDVPVLYCGGYPYVEWATLDAALDSRPGYHKRFSAAFGCQTCMQAGPFAYDVEAVLERLASGRLTGTQLAWD